MTGCGLQLPGPFNSMVLVINKFTSTSLKAISSLVAFPSSVIALFAVYGAGVGGRVRGMKQLKSLSEQEWLNCGASNCG